MNLRDLLKKHETDGVIFHSAQSNIDLAVHPHLNEVQAQEISSKTICLRAPYRGVRQVEHLLEDYGMKTDNFYE